MQAAGWGTAVSTTEQRFTRLGANGKGCLSEQLAC